MAPRFWSRPRGVLVSCIVLSCVVLACKGGRRGDADADDDADETGEPPAPPAELVTPVPLRRLSRYELDNTARDLFGDDRRIAQQLLPEDPRTPFDNDAHAQLVSGPWVESLEAFAKDVAQALVADPMRRAAVVGCTPNGASDEACMRSFVERIGRLARRRALDGSEVDELVALALHHAGDTGDFFTGVEVIVRALLQDPELVYRVEIGEPVDDEPGVLRLSDYEIAARLSFLLWGTTPDDALLAAAESGTLTDPEARREIAGTMLADPRARAHVDRFHALWLGFAELPHPADLTNAMRRETAALLERVIFDDAAPWPDLFVASETFVDATLAEHYGLPMPQGGEGWVSYGDDPRRGLLSHGSFLSVASSVADTSPTKRGQLVRERLMCQTIPPPPPDVMADEPPDETVAECKVDRYAIHGQGACASCHEQMDLVGFGLERYDRAGRYRTHDDGAPQCVIDGDGELVGVGAFHGPAGLGALLVEHELVTDCVVRHLHQFAIGRPLTPADDEHVAAIVEEFAAGDLRFDALLLAIVADDAFGFRRPEES